MLGKIFGKKCDHPMADAKSAQALLADLPRNDALKSISELTDWIESIAGREDCRLADQWSVLSLLDETAQPYARKLACEYFTLPDMHAFQGNRLCMALGNYSRQMAHAYSLMFARYCKDDAQIRLPLLAARAVRLMCEQLKYMAVHYQTYDETVWRDFAALYRHAEQVGYLDEPVNLYSAIKTTVRSEAGKLMAWHASGITSLSPRSMHLAELIFARNSDAIVLGSDPGNRNLCSFDPVLARAPVRILQDAKANPEMRYVSVSGMQARLGALIRALEKDIVPEEMHLGCPYAAEWVLEAARHVMAHVVTPPQRHGKRRELKAELIAIFGCENLFSGAAGRETDAMRMTLENASPGGFYAELAGKGADSVRIGHVFGVRTAGGLGVSIVRRLSRDSEGRLHVGAEILTNRASSVTLQGGEGGPQLWLHAEDGIATLLMQADVFSMQRSLKASLDGRNYLLMPVKLLESGLDYDLASFRVIEQEEE